MSFIRLYLVPRTPEAPQQVVDIDTEDLVLSNGAFVPVQLAKSLTMVGASVASQFAPFNAEGQQAAPISLSTAQQEEVRVCWREPVDTDDYPNEAVVAVQDPAEGECICAITCAGTNISYAKVQYVATTVTN